MATVAKYIAPENYLCPTGSTAIPKFRYTAEISDFHGNSKKWSTDSSNPSTARLINLSITVARGANPDTGSVTLDNTDFSWADTFKMGDRIKIWLGWEGQNFGSDNYIFGGYIQKIEPNLNQDIKLSVISWEAVMNTCSLPRVNSEYSGQSPESIICAIYNSSGLGGSCNTESTGLTFKKVTFKKTLVGNAIKSVYSQLESFKGNGREGEVECFAWDPDATTCGSCGGSVQNDGCCNSCGSSNNTCANCQSSACNNPCNSNGTGANCGTCGQNCKSCAGSCNGSCGGSSGTTSNTGGCSGGCSGSTDSSQDDSITGTKTYPHWDLWMDENQNLYMKAVKDACGGSMPVYTYGDNLIAANGLFNEIDCYNSVDCKACVGEGVKWDGLVVPLNPNLNLYTNNMIYLKTPMNDSKARIDEIKYNLSGVMTLTVVKSGSESNASDIKDSSDSSNSSCTGCS